MSGGTTTLMRLARTLKPCCVRFLSLMAPTAFEQSALSKIDYHGECHEGVTDACAACDLA